MAKTDFYELLGISKDTADADIKKAYRKLAMQYHPDRNPDDKEAEQKFKEINEAYDVLKDEQKRAAYDRFGHAAFDGSMGGGGPGGGGAGGFNFDFGGSFSDIFDDLFGNARRGGRGPTGPQRGSDLRYNYEVSLEEAFGGKKAEISITTAVTCDDCTGSGAAPGSSPVTSRAALLTICASRLAAPCEYAPSSARSQMMLIRRGTPPERVCTRRSAASLNSLRFTPATCRR